MSTNHGHYLPACLPRKEALLLIRTGQFSPKTAAYMTGKQKSMTLV
ncbi:MAG: hypothetical protein LBH01_00485 [Verrucomicrobiales bacterium]|jgi:hypothetical protein|nr:hypothetical protein [Verrucomicrobiales bacterium]